MFVPVTSTVPVSLARFGEVDGDYRTCDGLWGDAPGSFGRDADHFFPQGNVGTITSFFTNVQVQTVTHKGAVTTSCSASPQPGTTPPPSPTPTATPNTPAPTPTTPVNTVPNASPTSVVPVVVPSSVDGVTTVTQFSTYLLTTMDGNGRMTTQTSVDAIPASLQGQSGSNSSSNTGSIVGGVIGGLAGLLALLVLAWYLRKRGVFGKSKDDDLFNDEMWSPAPHSPTEPELLAGAGAGAMMGGAMSERRTSYGLPSLGHSARGSFGGQDGGYGSHYVDVDGYGPVHGGGANEVLAVGGYGGGERVAHRQSLQSGSGHSHDGSYGSQHYAPQQQLYQPMSHGPGLLPYAYDYNDAAHREEVVEGPRSSHSDHSDTVATTGSTNGNESRPSHSLRRPAMEPVPYSNSSSSGNGGSSGPSAASTAPSSPNSFGQGKMAPPTLKRPTSSESLQAPSQFLGARIANMTPAVEHSSFDFLTSPYVPLPTLVLFCVLTWIHRRVA